MDIQIEMKVRSVVECVIMKQKIGDNNKTAGYKSCKRL